MKPGHRLLAATLLALVSLPAMGADQQPQGSRKDAAEAVGEGNTARWLEYYRRERGENWKQPTAEDAAKPVPQEEKSPQAEPVGHDK